MATGENGYRRGVGVMLLNREGKVFVGARIDNTDEAWQMPQGGIDEDEDPYAAALRELYEETGIRSVQKLGEIADWLTYDLPREVVKTAWGGRYRGQKQKWYALRFTGKDGEINIDEPGGHKPEFVEWKWVAIRELPDLVIPFKRQTYERVVKEFQRFARQT